MFLTTQQIILTCLLGPEDPGAFAREKSRLYRIGWESQMSDRGFAYRKEKRRKSREKYPNAQKEATARWEKKFPKMREAARVVKQYGITLYQIEEARVKQENKCGGCGEEFTKTPHVDHNHATGEFRGLLCGPCNRAIGLLKDSAERCFSIGEYLSKGGQLVLG